MLGRIKYLKVFLKDSDKKNFLIIFKEIIYFSYLIKIYRQIILENFHTIKT